MRIPSSEYGIVTDFSHVLIKEKGLVFLIVEESRGWCFSVLISLAWSFFKSSINFNLNVLHATQTICETQFIYLKNKHPSRSLLKSEFLKLQEMLQIVSSFRTNRKKKTSTTWVPPAKLTCKLKGLSLSAKSAAKALFLILQLKKRIKRLVWRRRQTWSKNFMNPLIKSTWFSQSCKASINVSVWCRSEIFSFFSLSKS